MSEVGPTTRAANKLELSEWPPSERFPVNRQRAHVRDVIWEDLVSSDNPLLVAGYSSIGEIIDLISEWGSRSEPPAGRVRLVLGAEPFGTQRHTFRSDRTEFTDEARRYWLEERGISLRSSAKVLQTIEALNNGAVEARFIHGTQRLHAKIYRGNAAATVGSSNFTAFGLGQQFEANVRFEAAGEARRYRELSAIAENYWGAGDDWGGELRILLEELLRVVSWQEALGRACADLLEGKWAERYMSALGEPETQMLWPSQHSGIAEALWITKNVGSVLVADATGSGKTRMGAHLLRAVRDRLWRTGRVRRDLTALVGPPAVIDTWESEAIGIGLMLSKVSHGLLSRSTGDGKGREKALVRGAQILAVDEAHNFLNSRSNRTHRIRDSLADNVLLFTATPISKGAADLLNLVGLLGPDNFEDSTLEVLNRLERRRGVSGGTLAPDEVTALRREIQRFTVRRTKAQINAMVDRHPEAYLHPDTRRVCRYPGHVAHTYTTGETPDDESLAEKIRPIVEDLTGIVLLEQIISVPRGLRNLYTDDEWLRFRLKSAKGLARHHVLEALRSSRAAAVEHLAGTSEAVRLYGIDPGFKSIESGDMMTTVTLRGEAGPPDTTPLECDVEPWLRDGELWRRACLEEHGRYDRILDLVKRTSEARERTKAELLAKLSKKHDRVLAFDRHPITLAMLSGMLEESDLGETEVLLAIKQGAQRRRVTQQFAPQSQALAIALCSDAMNEGLNLQGASCIVHLDLPTTLRVAEQRVGRVDRMDSAHSSIEAWWPDDGPSFATRAYETLIRRARESEELLGSNLTLPEFEHHVGDSAIVSVAAHIEELAAGEREPWDGIHDALEPLRQLVSGPTAIIAQDVYEEYRHVTNRVLACVAPIASEHPWAFFSVAAISDGAPRWLIVDPAVPGNCITDLHEIAARLRHLLAGNPPARELDAVAAAALDGFLDTATKAEYQLLPRRMRRALEQMGEVVGAWARSARQGSDEEGGERWTALGTLANTDRPTVDPYLVAQRWLEITSPVMARHRAERGSTRYIRLRDITPRLKSEPFSYVEAAQAFIDLPEAAPLDERVTACILGVPDPPRIPLS